MGCSKRFHCALSWRINVEKMRNSIDVAAHKLGLGWSAICLLLSHQDPLLFTPEAAVWANVVQRHLGREDT